jgi:hypothetical protein
VKGREGGRHVTLVHEQALRRFGQFVAGHPPERLRRHPTGIAQKSPKRFRHPRRNRFIHGLHEVPD